MYIQKVKNVLPILTLSLLPVVANAQTKEVLSQQDTVTNVISETPKVENPAIAKDTLDLSQGIDKATIAEKTKKAAKKFIFSPDTKTSVGVNYFMGTDIPNPAIGANINFIGDKAILGARFLCARDEDKNAFAYDIHGQYNFDMGKGFAVYPKISVARAKIKQKGEVEKSSMIAPKVGAGVQYLKKFNSGINLYSSFDVDGAARMQEVTGTTDAANAYYCKALEIDFMARLAASYKNFMLYIEGGRDVNMGYNFGTGINFIF